MNEVWKEIPGYDGYYEVSNTGKVRSWRNNRWGRSDEPSLMSQGTNKNWGYKYVILSDNGDTNHVYVHRLVAESFIDNPKNKPQVNHKDGNKENN